MLYLCLRYETKTGSVFRSFFNIDQCSATSMESSRQDLLNDIAENNSFLKNNQNTYHPRFGFIPQKVFFSVLVRHLRHRLHKNCIF